jgi:uncharacterized protein YmfQ (DUF2313 family)
MHDYYDLLSRLLPRGLFWRQQTYLRNQSLAGQILAAWADELGQVSELVKRAISEAIPATADYLLSRWEQVMGLPEFFHYPASIEDRRRYLVAKLTTVGAQNASYFRALAKLLGGQNITVGDTPNIPWGWHLRCDDIETMSAGSASAGDYIVDPKTPAGRSIIAMANERKPAHTVVNY